MPSYEQKGMTISLKAAAAVPASGIYAPVKISADNTFAACAVGEAAVGFIQNEVVLGEAGQVMIQGITFAKAEATFAAGAILQAAATPGTVVVKSTGVAIGQALQAATVAGQIVSVLIKQA